MLSALMPPCRQLVRLRSLGRARGPSGHYLLAGIGTAKLAPGLYGRGHESSGLLAYQRLPLCIAS